MLSKATYSPVLLTNSRYKLYIYVGFERKNAKLTRNPKVQTTDVWIV